MRLSWQPGFTQSRRPAKRVRTQRSKRAGVDDSNGPRQFEFVVEQPQEHQNVEFAPSSPCTRVRHAETPAESVVNSRAVAVRDVMVSDTNRSPENERPSVICESQTLSDVVSTERQEHLFRTSLWASTERLSIGNDEVYHNDTNYATPGISQDWCESEEPCTTLSPFEQASVYQLPSLQEGHIGLGPSIVTPIEFAETIELDSATFLGLAETPHLSLTSIPPNVLYQSLSQKFRPVFERYDKEFCKIPITAELSTNPFQCRVDPDSEPTFLFHAVMALAGHHVGSTSALDHRYTALQGLRQSLGMSDLLSVGTDVLNTIIVLFSFDETQSALGNWSIHLQGAYSLLEACGGIDFWTKSTRSAAQVGMLLWWDAILSLVSREDPIFPYSYFEAIIANHNDTTQQLEHDFFFSLCGCPLPLVQIVMQLARLAPEKQKSTTMRFVRFDDSLVTQLERELEAWEHSPITTTTLPNDDYDEDEEESVQRDLDKKHCSEAWRHGLLLYIHRVFHWHPNTPVSTPTHILHRARTIMDHVSACRDESMVAKQALLPLIFAGCEMRDRSSRARILRLCAHWDGVTRYHVFRDAGPLLSEVWDGIGREEGARVWWGSVVDRWHREGNGGGGNLSVRICFG